MVGSFLQEVSTNITAVNNDKAREKNLFLFIFLNYKSIIIAAKIHKIMI